MVKRLYQLLKADFANDPGAAFSEGRAAMDVIDAGMPPPMMEMMQDFCSGAFQQSAAISPQKMDAFTGSADGLMAPFDMPLQNGCRFSSNATRYGSIYGWMSFLDFPGGEAFDPGAMPDTWEPGPMTDMGPNQDMGVNQI